MTFSYSERGRDQVFSSDLFLILLEESVPEDFDDLHRDCVSVRTERWRRRLLEPPLFDFRRHIVCQVSVGVRLLPFGVFEKEALFVANASH